jgi:hypothetical protein
VQDDFFENYFEESLKSAIRIGLSIEQYNEMTPYELNLHADIYQEKQKFEEEERLTLVWMGEYFQRIEKLPTLNEILGKKEETEEMTADEMLHNIMQLNSALGGTVKKAGE